MGTHVCEKIFAGVDYTHVALAVLAQFFISFFWFAGIFSSIFQYYLAADKGVRRFEKVVQRWSLLTSVSASIFAETTKALTIFAFANISGAQTLADFHTIAGIIIAVVLSMQHHAYWEQRPLPLILIAATAEAATALVGATVLFYLRAYDVKLL